jgi:hypothetical protein
MAQTRQIADAGSLGPRRAKWPLLVISIGALATVAWGLILLLLVTKFLL